MSTNITWNTVDIDGRKWLVWDGQIRVPLDWDPNSGVFIAVCPPGGIANIPALVSGKPGLSPDLTVVMHPVDPDDDLPDSYSEVLDAGGPGVASQVKLHLYMYRGQDGADTGIHEIAQADDVAGEQINGATLVYRTETLKHQYEALRVGDWYVPANIDPAGFGSDGGPTRTLIGIRIPGQPWDWKPEVDGGATIIGTGADLLVDLFVRVGNPTSGHEVGRAFGVAGQYPPPMTLISGPPIGSGLSYGKVAAGDEVVIYFRAEKQSGTASFSVDSSRLRFKVRVEPLP